MKQLQITRQDLLDQLASFEVFNTVAFFDSETNTVVELAEDVVDYCRGEVEGTDLQLSDSHELPLAQAVAEELDAAESGFDSDGVPFDESDRRFYPFPRLGDAGESTRREELDKWLEEYQLRCEDGE